MAKKGWYASEMNTWNADKKKAVLEQYGQEGLTENTYNWLRARVKKNDDEVAQMKAKNPAMETLRGSSTRGLDVGYVDPSTIVVNPTDKDVQKYLYNESEGDGGTYYGGTIAGTDITGSKKTKATNKSAVDFLNEYQNDPAMLFNPNYANTRKQITDKQWIQLIERHPEYWNSLTSRYIPDSAQTKLMQRGIRQATDKAAEHVIQGLLGATNPVAALSSLVGAAVTDEIVKLASDKYDGWQDLAASKLREAGLSDDLAINVLSTFSNPGAWVGGVAASYATPTYSFTTSPMSEVTAGGKTREMYTSEDLRAPKIEQTKSRTITVPKGMAETAADGITTLELPTVEKVVSAQKISKAIPVGPEGGLGHGKGRIGGGGKGINPRGQIMLDPITRPQVVRGNTRFDVSLPYVTGLPPIEFTTSDHPITVQWRRPVEDIPNGKPWAMPDFYQTGYDWGDPEFQAWWSKNAPGNEGKVLDYKGRKIKIEYDPNGYRRTNIHTGLPGGTYPQGSITGREVLGERHLTPPQPLVIPGNAVVMSNPALTPYRVTLGDTVTLKTGGSLNYLNYIK